MATIYSSFPVGAGYSTFPMAAFGGGVVNQAYGGYTFSATPSSGDVLKLFYLPACKVFDGALRGQDLDTGTETLDCDVGTPDDTDAFGNFGVITGDVVTELKPEVGIYLPFGGLLRAGPVSLTAASTSVILTFNAAPATFAAGAIWVSALYTCQK